MEQGKKREDRGVALVTCWSPAVVWAAATRCSGTRGARRRKGKLDANGFGNEAEEVARGSGARGGCRGARGPPSPDRARVLERETRSRESGAALVGSDSIPRNEEAGRGGFGPWVRALVCGDRWIWKFWWWLVGAKGIPRWENESGGGGGGFDGWTARARVSSEYIAVG